MRSYESAPTVLALLACGGLLAGCGDGSVDPVEPTQPTEAAFGKSGKPGGEGTTGVETVVLQGLTRRGATRAYGVNSSGIVVGSAVTASGASVPVRWLPQAGAWGAPSILTSSSEGGGARAINDAGYVVGTVRSGSVSIAVVWTPDGTPVELGPGFPQDINERNTIVGSVPGVGPVVWRFNAGMGTWAMEPLPVPGGGSVNGAWAIDDLEDVVYGSRPEGVNPSGGSAERAIAWRYVGGSWSEPSPLNQTGFVSSTGRDSHGGGNIVGGAVAAGGQCYVVVRWGTSSAQPSTIAGLATGSSSANDQTRTGEIVGTANPDGCVGGRAFWWSPIEGLRWLSSKGGEAHAAAGEGVVVGVLRGAATTQAVAWRMP